MERLDAQLSYEWVPFTVDGKHLTFAQHKFARLDSRSASHWGPAIYKWQGPVSRGEHSGQLGILIGETSDLRQRVKQYVSGTQERGNKLWRDTFLELGEIRLYTLDLHDFVVVTAGGERRIATGPALGSANHRLVLEQLLVMKTASDSGDTTWIVNARK